MCFGGLEKTKGFDPNDTLIVCYGIDILFKKKISALILKCLKQCIYKDCNIGQIPNGIILIIQLFCGILYKQYKLNSVGCKCNSGGIILNINNTKYLCIFAGKSGHKSFTNDFHLVKLDQFT